MIHSTARLSLSTLFSAYWGRICITWGLTLLEMVMFVLFPLLIGKAIDGLIADDSTAFLYLIIALVTFTIIAITRRVYDTRVYGTIRLELGKAQASRSFTSPVSITNARVLMGQELAEFLESMVPVSMTAIVQTGAAVVILGSFHGLLTVTTSGALIVSLLIYWLFSNRFFNLNSALNNVSEEQVSALESRNADRIATFFTNLRREEVRLSDTESIVYGIILLAPLTMVTFNLWFGSSKLNASPGEIFSIVSYSLQFVQASMTLPMVLQNLTRLNEITERINRTDSEIEESFA